MSFAFKPIEAKPFASGEADLGIDDMAPLLLFFNSSLSLLFSFAKESRADSAERAFSFNTWMSVKKEASDSRSLSISYKNG